MAAVEPNGGSKKGQSKGQKKSTRVDLTPMVDLGFLLITFFVFTTTMTTPTVMNVNMPYDKTVANDDVCNSCVLTVLLGKNDRIKYYEGALENRSLDSTNYTSIRAIIQQKKRQVQRVRGNSDEFVLIIKSADASAFKNFVDITDEVTINNVKRYYIDEISVAEMGKAGQSF